jgi:hypothetical protein
MSAQVGYAVQLYDAALVWLINGRTSEMIGKG